MKNEEIKLMVVEDDEAIRGGIIDILTLEGFQVVESCNGREALNLLADYKPDMVISDVMMPEMDGHQLLEEYRLRTDVEDVPFLFLSALADKTDVRKGMNLGADDYLTKPFSRAELLEAIEAQYHKYMGRRNFVERRVEERFNEENKLQSTEKEMLVKEMHHRVKHNLAVISAFFELGELADDPHFIETIRDRVTAMATIHEEAYSNDFISRVNAKKLIFNIMDQLFAKEGITIIKQADPMDMDINRAIPLGLLLYEFLNLLLSKGSCKENVRIQVNSYKLFDKASLIITLNGDCDLDLDSMESSVEVMLIRSFLDQLKGSYVKEYMPFGTTFSFNYSL